MIDALALWPLSLDGRRALLRTAERAGVTGHEFRVVQHLSWAMLGLMDERRCTQITLRRARRPDRRRALIAALAAIDRQGWAQAHDLAAWLADPGRAAS